jgi:outer membrane lipopolysaccharide assembly protein LptE/RlpB
VRLRSRTSCTPLLLVVSALALTGCGYHIAGQASLLPKDVKTIAIAPWANVSIHYTLSNYLAAAVSREFISRSRYRIVSDVSKADAVLYGVVANMTSGGTIYDNSAGRTTAGQITVQIQYRLLDRTGKVLISKPNMEFRERYEIAVNPGQYFDESEAAMSRLSVDVAKDLVSSILEQF